MTRGWLTVLGQLGHVLMELFCWDFFHVLQDILGCVGLCKYLKQETVFH